MKRYRVSLKQTYYFDIDIYADTERDAEDIALAMVKQIKQANYTSGVEVHSIEDIASGSVSMH